MIRLGFAVAILLALSQVNGFAADVTVTQTTVAVATSTTPVTSRPSRRILVIVNMSDVAISCKFGADAVVGEGIVLNPQLVSGQAGGIYFFDIAVPVNALNCIHGGTGTKNVSIIEG